MIYQLHAFICTLINYYCYYYYFYYGDDDEMRSTHQWVMPVLCVYCTVHTAQK